MGKSGWFPVIRFSLSRQPIETWNRLPNPFHSSSLSACWWLTACPSEKIWKLGWWFPIHGKIKNDPNHQPVMISISMKWWYLGGYIMVYSTAYWGYYWQIHLCRQFWTFPTPSGPHANLPPHLLALEHLELGDFPKMVSFKDDLGDSKNMFQSPKFGSSKVSFWSSKQSIQRCIGGLSQVEADCIQLAEKIPN